MLPLPLLAELGDAAVTLPWPVWVAIGTALVSAVAWMAKTWKSSVESNNVAMVTLVREVTASVTATNATLREILETLKDMRRDG